MKIEDVVSIVQTTTSSKETLLNKTTTVSLNGSSFLSKLNSQTNTVTIINTNTDYVFKSNNTKFNGCENEGNLTCLNGSHCELNSSCECKNVFSGINCSSCKSSCKS